MQSKTLRIREAMRALPDDVLLTKVLRWSEELDPDGSGWELNPDDLTMLGYRVQSNVIGNVYATLDDLWEAEEDTEEWTVLPLTPATIRQAVSDLSSDDVYHQGLSLFMMSASKLQRPATRTCRSPNAFMIKRLSP